MGHIDNDGSARMPPDIDTYMTFRFVHYSSYNQLTISKISLAYPPTVAYARRKHIRSSTISD